MLTEKTTAMNALEGFATHLDSFWGDAKFHEGIITDWNSIPLNREDLAGRVRGLAQKIEALADDQIDEDLKRKLKLLPEQIAWFQNRTLPQLPTGNLPVVLSNFNILLSNIEGNIPSSSLPAWEDVANSTLIPRDLARRIRNLEAAVKRSEARSETLTETMKAIHEAHAAALDLPTDLQSLKEARDELESHKKNSELAIESIIENEKACDGFKLILQDYEKEAAKQIKNIDSAYSAATTAGLAASFTERAGSLTRSTRMWVGLLFFALSGGAVIGYVRLESFQDMVSTPGINHQILWVNAIMSLLSIAAPVWFAWLATRQIGQRFRLAEDYAFKASVARAYEGYRKEAARLDPELEARLFASALDRLDEAPLRFLATEEHGSPYEALLASAGFQKALEKIPSLRDAVTVALERAGGSRNANSRAPSEP